MVVMEEVDDVVSFLNMMGTCAGGMLRLRREDKDEHVEVLTTTR